MTLLPDQITIDGQIYVKKKDLAEFLADYDLKQCQMHTCLNIIHKSKTFCLECVRDGRHIK